MSGDSRWYFSLNQEVYGPVATVELQDLLASGKLPPSAMVLKEGEKKWQAAEGLAELYAGQAPSGEPTQAEAATEAVMIGSSETIVSGLDPAALHWVVLKEVQEDGKPKFLQDGPFSTDEVLEKVQSGELRYSDHCWREGFSSWRLIREEPLLQAAAAVSSSFEEFSPPTQAAVELPRLEDIEEVSGSVQFSETEVLQASWGEDPPEEVSGPDLTEEAPEGDLSFVFTDETMAEEPKTAVLPGPDGPGPAQAAKEPSVKDDEEVPMELAEREDSVVKEPLIAQDFSKVEVPHQGAPGRPRSYTSSSRPIDQPHVRQKLLEAQMSSPDRPRSSYGFRFLILLLGGVLLLLFGLRLAQDLGN